MDAQNVKFYMMDTEDSDEQFAMASGDSIFMASGRENDEKLIKHELTHIYQQAIGTATESNADDTSLEEEAINVSKESENIPVKSQSQRDKYILPKEKTNVVQFLGALAIAGIAIGGAALVAGIAGGINKLLKKIKLKWMLKKYLPEKQKKDYKYVKKLPCKFSFAKKGSHSDDEIFDRMLFGICSNTYGDVKSDAEVLQRAYINPNVTDDDYGYVVRPVISDYRDMVKFGFKGFNHEEPALKYFGIDLTNSEDDLYLGPKLTRFMKLYVLTKGFKERAAKKVSADFKNLLNQDFEKMNEQGFNTNNYDLSYYEDIYKNTFGFSKISSKHIRKLSRKLFGVLRLEAVVGGVDLLIKLFSNHMGEVNQKGLDELLGNILKIADILHIKRTGNELKKLISDLYNYCGHNQIYSSYLRSGEIIPIIEELVKTDKYKGKIGDNIGCLLNDCVKKIDNTLTL